MRVHVHVGHLIVVGTALVTDRGTSSSETLNVCVSVHIGHVFIVIVLEVVLMIWTRYSSLLILIKFPALIGSLLSFTYIFLIFQFIQRV